METDSDQAKAPYELLDAGLLIVTGASHTGKTSVIEAILPSLDPPVAQLSVDTILTASLVRPPGDRWEQIPLAYELIERQTEALLKQGWLVIVESTFTFVPPENEPVFHRAALQRLVDLAASQGAPSVVCQVQAPLELVLERAKKTKRLPLKVVKGTVRLHDNVELPGPAMKLSTADRASREAADELGRHLERRLNRR